MIAEFGGTMKVSGRTIATPLTEPSPGMAPMNRPAVTPSTTTIRFSGVSEVANPLLRSASISMDDTPQKNMA